MNTEPQKPTLTIRAENAAKTLEWIRRHGGVALWKSINLSNLGMNWHTPATIAIRSCDGKPSDGAEVFCPTCKEKLVVATEPAAPSPLPVTSDGGFYCCSCKKPVLLPNCLIQYPKPSWQADSKPAHIFKDHRDVIVSFDKEVKRFHVATRMGSQGTMIKLTDASSRRVRKEVEKAGEGAYHAFDYGTQECVIMAPEKTMTLEEWAKEQKV